METLTRTRPDHLVASVANLARILVTEPDRWIREFKLA